MDFLKAKAIFKKHLLIIWWAIVWRFSTLLALLLTLTFIASAVLHSIYSVSIDVVLGLAFISIIISSLVVFFIVLRSVIGRPYSDFLLVILTTNIYQNLFPKNTGQVNCRLTKWFQPYRMSILFMGEKAYSARQLNSNNKVFTIIDSDGLEVAHCSTLSLLNEETNQFIIARSDKEERSIELQFEEKPNRLLLQIGDYTETIHYTDAEQDIAAIGAILYFRWNRINVLYRRDQNILSEPLFAAVIFFIFLQRSHAGGW